METEVRSSSAFIVMSFDCQNHNLEDVANAIKDTCKEASIDAFRTDDITHLDRIADVILSSLKSCDLVIADLSHERPNVYYELGYAHATGKPVIMVAAQGINLPFDVRDYNVLFYTNITSLKRGLAARLSKLAAEMHTRLGSSPPSTICAECVFLLNKEPTGLRKDVWYNHLCKASPLERKVDPSDGLMKPHRTNDFGRSVFVDAEYAYCRDVNDGHCNKFQPNNKGV